MEPSTSTATQHHTVLCHDVIVCNNNKNNSKLQPRCIPSNFQCGEQKLQDVDTYDEYENPGRIEFYCTVPSPPGRLAFRCRDRSVGVLDASRGDKHVLTNEVMRMKRKKKKEQEDEQHQVDPFFFDDGYTLAGRTGFQVWAGSRLLLESLLYSYSGDNNSSRADPPRLIYWQERLLLGKECRGYMNRTTNILELGAGVGLVGISLAAASGTNHVLLTDLPTLVEHSVEPNLKRNSVESEDGDDESMHSPPEWLSALASYSEVYPMSSPAGAGCGTRGFAAATPLDWTKPLHNQLQHVRYLNNVDLIVASDCVWLTSMLEALLDTVSSIFDAAPKASFILSLQRRDNNDAIESNGSGLVGTDFSTMFTTVESVVEAIQMRGWHWECLAWRYTLVESEQEEQNNDNDIDDNNEDGGSLRKQVYVLEVRRQEKGEEEDGIGRQ